jgi:hypothetical protein
MYLKSHAKGENWMTDEERKVWRLLGRRLRNWARKRGVPGSPLLLLRIREIGVLIILGYRLEARLDLSGDPVEPPADLPCKTRPTPAPAAVLESVAKHWEKTRKAINELEAHCGGAKPDAPVRLGIADVMKPIMKKAQAILERLPEEER